MRSGWKKEPGDYRWKTPERETRDPEKKRGAPLRPRL